MLQSPLDHTTGHPSGEVEPQSPFKYFACVNAAPIDSRESLKLRGREPLGIFSFRDLRLHLFHSPSVTTSYVLTSSSSRHATRLGGGARNLCREDVIQDGNLGSCTTGVGIAEKILVATPLTRVRPVVFLGVTMAGSEPPQPSPPDPQMPAGIAAFTFGFHPSGLFPVGGPHMSVSARKCTCFLIRASL